METCKKCGKPINYVGNFCPKCGSKLYEVCPVCWQHDRQPYNCGQNSCQIKKVPVGVGAPDKDNKVNRHLNCKVQKGESQMKNKYALIGQLKIMKEFSQNDVQKSYLRSAIATLEGRTPKNDDITSELAAALDMLSYELYRRDAEVLRDTVEYLESLDCEV